MKITQYMIDRAIECMPDQYWAHPAGSCSVRARVEVLLSAALRDEHEQMALCKHCREPIARYDDRWNHLAVPQPQYGQAFNGFTCRRPPETKAEPA